ncbi:MULTISPECIES: class I lanthipeptide [unclassified Flavobacterium]|uniref:class I lanthipeptide n=1 Tax=unclassified Flavobacterium TaxID=196869 RepID=UPI00360E39A5
MKKQNVKNKLAFDKLAIVELNDTRMIGVYGGELTDAVDAVSNVVTKLMDQANEAGYAVSYAITTKIR